MVPRGKLSWIVDTHRLVNTLYFHCHWSVCEIALSDWCCCCCWKWWCDNGVGWWIQIFQVCQICQQQPQLMKAHRLQIHALLVSAHHCK